MGKVEVHTTNFQRRWVMSSWRECKLGEVISSISDTYKFTDEKVVFLNTSDVYLGKIINKNEFNPKDLPGQAKKRIKKNDLLFSEIRPANGRYALVVDDVENYVVSTKLMVLRSSENILPNFLNIFLTSKDMLEYLQMLAEDRSGTFPQITFDNISNIDISLPPIEEQKAIAEVLSSLDDKIDLLHRQNHTLESLAQTLFRQWFIEEAKEEWEEKPLSKIADFLNGLACQKFPPQNDIDKLPVLKIKDLKDGISENSDYVTSDVKPEYIVNNGDVIFAWSASLMVKIWDGEQCVLNQHLFKVTSKDFPKWFYYHWCKYHLDNFIAISSAHATTMGHIKRGDLDEAMCVIPSSEELIKMDDEISPIFEKIETNSRQIKSLEKMRDTLLPKLLSGEVRVEI